MILYWYSTSGYFQSIIGKIWHTFQCYIRNSSFFLHLSCVLLITVIISSLLKNISRVFGVSCFVVILTKYMLQLPTLGGITWEMVKRKVGIGWRPSSQKQQCYVYLVWMNYFSYFWQFISKKKPLGELVFRSNMVKSTFKLVTLIPCYTQRLSKM